MGGIGSGRRGRRAYNEELALDELLQMSITTLKRVLTSDVVSDDRKAQIALVLASRRVTTKSEATLKVMPSQDAILLERVVPAMIEAKLDEGKQDSPTI